METKVETIELLPVSPNGDIGDTPPLGGVQWPPEGQGDMSGTKRGHSAAHCRDRFIPGVKGPRPCAHNQATP